MHLIDKVVQFRAEIQQLRRDIHAHPELRFEENRTSDLVAARLADWGYTVNRGLGAPCRATTLSAQPSLHRHHPPQSRSLQP